MTDRPGAAEIGSMSFEEAMAELEAIVRSLESGEAKLDEAIDRYERGALLRAHCQAKLSEATLKVERIGQAANGGLESRDLDSE